MNLRFRPDNSPVLGRLILPAVLLLLNGCYVMDQGVGFLALRHRAEPIEKLRQDPSTPDSLVRFFELTDSIRSFARHRLGLAEDDNFTTFVQTDKQAVVTVVTACAPDTFRPHTWWFPIVGTVPYKGFFDSTDARKEAARLRDKDLDVYARPAGAFSSLGFFTDPLYSYMADYNRHNLAGLIIHEQVHATVFFKSEMELNESMAVFIARWGALEFVRETQGDTSEAYDQARNTRQDRDMFHHLFLNLYTRLDSVYALGRDEEKTIKEKETLIQRFKQRYARIGDSLFITEAYRTPFQREINNAVLTEFKTYNYDLSLMQRLFDAHDRDPVRMVAFLKNVGDSDREPMAMIRERIGK